MNSLLNEIQKIVNTWKGHPFDACLEIIQKISEDKTIEPWVVIKEVLSNPVRIGNNEADIEGIEKDTFHCFIYRYQEYLTNLLETLSMKDDEQDVFYKEMYSHVFESSIIPEDQYHQAMYLYLLSDRIKFVPYYPTINSLKLKEEVYREIFESIGPQLSMAFHMCARKFDTKSETASQYWEIASSLKTREEQIVFWSVVIDMEKKNKKSGED